MNGKVVSWKSEKIVLPAQLVVVGLPGVVVDSLVLVAAAALEVALAVVVVALEVAEEGLVVVAMVEDVAVLVVVPTMVLPHQGPAILPLFPPTTSPTMPQVEETAVLQSTFAM